MKPLTIFSQICSSKGVLKKPVFWDSPAILVFLGRNTLLSARSKDSKRQCQVAVSRLLQKTYLTSLLILNPPLSSPLFDSTG